MDRVVPPYFERFLGDVSNGVHHKSSSISVCIIIIYHSIMIVIDEVIETRYYQSVSSSNTISTFIS